jgi:hypothetical protein
VQFGSIDALRNIGSGLSIKRLEFGDRPPASASGEGAGIVDAQLPDAPIQNISGLPQGVASRPAAGWSRRGDGAENTGVRALGINGATSESTRLTELPLAGVCHGFRELLRPVRR